MEGGGGIWILVLDVNERTDNEKNGSSDTVFLMTDHKFNEDITELRNYRYSKK